MTHPDIMRARAKRLYDEALEIEDPARRLAQVLKATELEAEAQALEREHAAIPGSYLDPQTSIAVRGNP